MNSLFHYTVHEKDLKFGKDEKGMKKIKQISYAGSLSQEETKKERRHRELSARAAAECMVLLENHGMLPLKEGERIALFGAGARQTVTGGTGSGDVNERYSVNIEEGLKNAGFTITTAKWLDAYDEMESGQKKEHYKNVFMKAAMLQQEKGIGMDDAIIEAYTATAAYIPCAGEVPTMDDVDGDDVGVAIYVLARNAGEGKDRVNEPGDYQLAKVETDSILFLRKHFSKVLVVVNCGGVMDLSFQEQCKVDALLVINQPGMEAGNALAKVIKGEVTPSAKLTDTWPMHYEDYPNYATYSHNSGDVSKEYYQEGIYVGYRYFDKAGIAPRYSFGHGLSYTSFTWSEPRVMIRGEQVTAEVNVTNMGDVYAGKEVMQLYVGLPSGKIAKETKRLVSFAKTKLLAPGESERILLDFDVSDCASYDEKRSAYILEAGAYAVLLGNASDAVSEVARVCVEEEIIVRRVAPVCPLQEELRELKLEEAPCGQKSGGVVQMSTARDEENAGQVPTFMVNSEAVQKPDAADVDNHESYAPFMEEESEEVKEVLDRMTEEQMASLVCGVSSGMTKTDIGMSAVTVVGAAGETTSDYAKEPWNLANIILADGPAGLRLTKNYQLDPEGKPYQMGLIEQFMKPTRHEEGTDYYQYCTRIPSGTALAQSFDLELVEEVGRMVAEEMEEFHVTLWLAPGMNIHRNPLCGRNFEYYSEDPYLTGKMAAAMTRGVQSRPGVGTTIKHFACNNQEDNRQHCDSVVSERALREIYLKGFEIAIKESSPLAVMTSYNLVNGIHAANNYDLCTNVLRREWGYRGLVMTDWGTTGKGGSGANLCIRAGNDLIMPRTREDVEEIVAALRSGEAKIRYQELRNCACRVARTILRSNRYE